MHHILPIDTYGIKIGGFPSVLYYLFDLVCGREEGAGNRREVFSLKPITCVVIFPLQTFFSILIIVVVVFYCHLCNSKN